MLGSSLSIAGPNVVLNTIVAEALNQFADELETADDFQSALNELIKTTIKKHKRILFNGNGYDDAWVKEAERRGLLNLKSTPECLPYFLHDKNIAVFEKQKVLSRTEMESRYEILMDSYCKVINIEALTMIEMVKREMLPAVSAFSSELASTIKNKKSVSPDICCVYEEDLLNKLTALLKSGHKRVGILEYAVLNAKELTDITELGKYYHDKIFISMSELRVVIDELETITAKTYWPYPSYGHLLFGIR